MIAPRLGTMLGGTPILVGGPCLTASDTIECIFDGLVTTGYYVSEIRALCFSPPFPVSGSRILEVRISNDTAVIFNGRTQFFAGKRFVIAAIIMIIGEPILNLIL